MGDRPLLLEIGVIGRAHGLKGEVSVSLSTNVTGRLVEGSTFETDHGPLTVLRLRPHQGRELVTFEGVTDRSAAEQLSGTRLLAEPLDEQPEDGYWAHELIGSTARDSAGVDRGVIVEVEANPASDLLVLDTGALVPVHFIVGVADRFVDIDPPDGLFDL